ncbi:MAG TPA: hypothetical protein VFM95_09020 [Microcella sp.]|nr:hypothetical protein [Microcella sp.]
MIARRVLPRHASPTAAFAAAFAAAIALAVSGCSITPVTDVTDQQARDRFIALVDAAEDAAGGTWEVQDDPSQRECTIPLWVPGTRISALRTGPAPHSDVADVTARMEAHFEEAGLTVTVSDIGDVVEVRGESVAGELLLFRVSETAMTLSGESECRPA